MLTIKMEMNFPFLVWNGKFTSLTWPSNTNQLVNQSQQVSANESELPSHRFWVQILCGGAQTENYIKSFVVIVDLTPRAQRRKSKLHFYWEHFRRTDCFCCYEIMLLCSFMNVGATFKNTACIRALCASVCISRKLNLRLGEQDWELKQAPGSCRSGSVSRVWQSIKCDEFELRSRAGGLF